jgi:hypothetical protein
MEERAENEEASHHRAAGAMARLVTEAPQRVTRFSIRDIPPDSVVRRCMEGQF